MSDTRIETTRAIAATATEIFAVISSPQGHVDIDSSGMLMAADGELAETEKSLCAAASASMNISGDEFVAIVNSMLDR